MSISIKKTDLRLKMYALREKIDLTQGSEASQKLIDSFNQYFKPPSSSIIASYWPMGSEMDTRPLLRYLYQSAYRCCLPCVENQGIVFREWTPSTPMVQGYFSVFEPKDTFVLNPDILLVPLLAFDLKGQRLGYGKGHYDRYLESLRRTKDIIAIGIAFEEQKLEFIPVKSHDQPLDYVLTQSHLYTFGQEKHIL